MSAPIEIDPDDLTLDQLARLYVVLDEARLLAAAMQAETAGKRLAGESDWLDAVCIAQLEMKGC